MNRSLEPALTSLIPTYNGALPPELLQLARSILSQSQSKVAALKPEEEAARSYICAHLACDRLKQSLNLPSIAARPPLPPRAYKKLYAYFDTTIPLRTARHAHLSKNATPTSSPSKSRLPATTPIKATPTKVATPSKARTTQNNAAANTQSRGTAEDDVPEWVMKAVRRLCTTFEARGAIPHLYAGVCSVSKAGMLGGTTSKDTMSVASISRAKNARPSGQTSHPGAGEPIPEERIPGLIIALFIYVRVRLSGESLSPEQFLKFSYKAIDVLREVEEIKERTIKQMKLDVNQFTREAQKGWLKLEWYKNIEPGSGLSGERPERDWDIDEDGDVDIAESSANAYTPEMMGAGNMMQGQVNYWSEEARRDFEGWKEEIMKRIETINAAKAQQPIVSTSG